MPNLNDLPPELLLQIFELCDAFSQAVSFVSVNKRCLSVWEARKPSILWHIGRASIVGFEDALMAVRATTIVQEHLQLARLPPHPFPFASISGRHTKPSLHELISVFDLQHLVNCLETMQLNHSDWSSENDLEFLEGPGIWKTWRERLHRSIYRIFLAAAALTGAYQQPFLGERPDCPLGFMDAYNQQFLEDPDKRKLEERLDAQEFQYLLQFPIYNLQSFDCHDAAFGPLAQTLLGMARERDPKEVDDPQLTVFLSNSSVSMPEAKVLFTEVAQLLAALVCIHQFLDETPATLEATRKAVIVDFDGFFPVEVEMPLRPEDARSLHYRFVSYESSETPYLGPLDAIPAIVHDQSGQPNFHGPMCPAPPHPLQFFQYVYRKYLGLRFSKTAFEQSKYAGFPNWVLNANIFSDRFSTWVDSMGGTLIVDTPLPLYYQP
ncbi:hypothetical protein BDV18DRAFT_160122 [Aspergillus unguis]